MSHAATVALPRCAKLSHMFTWICPQCGAEVPPSYDECPKCAEKAKAAATQAAAAPVVPPPVPPVAAMAPPAPPAPPAPQAPPSPVYPQPAAYPAQSAYPAQPVYPYAVPVKQGPPAWLVTLGVAAAFVLGGYGLYSYLGSRGAQPPAVPVTQAEPAASAKGDDKKSGPFEKPIAGNAEKKSGEQNRPSPTAPMSSDQLAKHLEAVGIRFTEENRRTVVTMAIVNHSGAEMTDLRGKIRILSKDGEKTVSTVDFRMPTLGPYEVRDYSIPLLTTMRAYELPDWQFLKAEIELR